MYTRQRTDFASRTLAGGKTEVTLQNDLSVSPVKIRMSMAIPTLHPLPRAIVCIVKLCQRKVIIILETHQIML